ncbi:MAG TPA: hypothetical protein VNR00_07930 [Opitutus sp.]|nr:hypothetical protein [Opitutus sp.]
MNTAQLSRGLGWFSIGLGLAELLAPRHVARAIGVNEECDPLLRFLGVREIAAGLGLIGRPKPTGFMWARVAGDAMDLGLLAVALRQHDSRPRLLRQFREDERRRLLIAMATVAGITIVDTVVSLRLSQSPRTEPGWRYTPAGGRAGIRAEAAGGVAGPRPPEEPKREPAAAGTSTGGEIH